MIRVGNTDIQIGKTVKNESSSTLVIYLDISVFDLEASTGKLDGIIS